ncbi:MAG: hypothetical protein FJW39_27155 [Acidobacteria bacterium]|nr:hypothetical protein [Acidobacteriota bacterium]
MAAAVQAPAAEERHRAKFGRNTPAFENAEKSAQARIAAHVAKCAGLGRCPQVAVETSAPPASPPASDVALNTANRLRMKLGITHPPTASREEAPAPSAHAACQEACCSVDH